MKAKYIDKTFPITLQDLIDLAKSENKDPRDLKLIMNEHNPNYTGYAQCAVLNQDCDKISIELYSDSTDGFSEDKNIKRFIPKSPHQQPRIKEAYHILSNIRDIADTKIIQVSEEDLKSLTESEYQLQIFYQKQR